MEGWLFFMHIFEFLREIFFYSGYFGSNTKSFPKPLEREEEKKYIALYMQGDEHAREVLIEHNLRLVAHIAKKFAANNTSNIEDYISIGTIGLIKGVNTFRIEKGSQLATYIARCIENEILMYLRAGKKNSVEVFLAEFIGEDKEGNTLSLIDILGADENSVDEQVELKMETEKLKGILEKVLTKRELLVIELRYGLGGAQILPQREIAKRLGISRSYVSRIEKKALGKLNRELNKKR